jgi:ubiquinone/menaquinone biosynthesis C-methylase UbiE
MTEDVYDLSEGWNGLAADMLYACMPGGAPADEVAFYERRIRANGGSALDEACGTGRHLFPLLARGLDVHGADISADALQLARREAEEQKVHVTLYHQRMEACDLPHRYGTIYVANGTFHIIIDRQEALSTLERFRDQLTPGGQVLLELSIPPEVTQGPTCHDAEHPIRWDPVPRRGAEGEIVTTLWSESVDLFEQTLLSKRRYDLCVDGECVRSEVHAHVMRWYFHHEFVMMLERAGFDDITTYGDYTGHPATKDSRTVIYGARRPHAS